VKSSVNENNCLAKRHKTEFLDGHNLSYESSFPNGARVGLFKLDSTEPDDSDKPYDEP
jgi:hypothetical protein